MIASSLRQRLDLLVHALDPDASGSGSWEQASAAVVAAGHRGVWLAIVVLTEEFPVRTSVVRWARALRGDAPARVLRRLAHEGAARRLRRRSIELIEGGVVVDVHHTARTRLATGIQRVVRSTITEWARDHELVLVGWDAAFRGLRRLTGDERRNALEGTRPHSRHPRHTPMVIPWNAVYILPELAVEPPRTPRMAALAEFSGNRTVVVGHDTVPVTSAETTGSGMGGVFGRYLNAIARFDTVATVSQASATEFGGWQRMLAGAGLPGPEVHAVGLPTEARLSGLDDNEVRAALGVDDLPVVLCVGSHEPRKNHLAVLAAAAQLWARGREFALVFVGGNSWAASEFDVEVARLRAAGRQLLTASAISDEVLAGVYRSARVTVFPSLHEGFGLPVAESLAAGTPVVTSAYGSMREIAASGGAILIDPRSDLEIAGALDEVLFDDAAYARLSAEARARPIRSWADYAAELWDLAVGRSSPTA